MIIFVIHGKCKLINLMYASPNVFTFLLFKLLKCGTRGVPYIGVDSYDYS